ncbi:LysR family transcriptional regulator [Frankia sp. Hr75.2]|nr:LysR family transcriptional regulator [Frankia sp. Hr75.2]
MEVRQLEYFVAVAEEANFTRAATRCHVVQSALSYQIARLEREIDLRLFERTSRSVRLSQAGELLLPYARRILAELDQATSALAGLSGVVTGQMRLGMIGAVETTSEIETMVADFHRRHPGVEIAISDNGSVIMAEQVRIGELDLAFVGLFADQIPDGLAHRMLATEPLVAVVGRTHPLFGHTYVRLPELAKGTRFIELRTGSGLRLQVDAAFTRAGITTRTIAFELTNLGDIIRFAALGLGAAIVTASAARKAAEASGDIGVLRLDDHAARHTISLIYRKPAPSAPSARAFLATLDGS